MSLVLKYITEDTFNSIFHNPASLLQHIIGFSLAKTSHESNSQRSFFWRCHGRGSPPFSFFCARQHCILRKFRNRRFAAAQLYLAGDPNRSHRSRWGRKLDFGFQSKFQQNMLVWCLHNQKMQKIKSFMEGSSLTNFGNSVFKEEESIWKSQSPSLSYRVK